jgi:hypothetical protein
MCGQKERNNLLKDNRGASLLFVLGIMMFLLVICTSVLVAAGNNVSYMVNQREYSQIQALDESIHRAIMFSLQANGEDDVEDPASLGLQLAYALYDARADFGAGLAMSGMGLVPDPDPDAPTGILLDYALLELRSNSRIRISRIEFSFVNQWVDIMEAVPALCLWVDDGLGGALHNCAAAGFCIAREPGQAWVDADLQVMVDIEVDFVRLGTPITRTASTRAVYSYTGGHLSEVADPDFDPWAWRQTEAAEGEEEDEAPALVFDDVGRWVLESYETIRN